jgi:hypothetical protein
MLGLKCVLCVLRVQMRNIQIFAFPLSFYLLRNRHLGLVKYSLEAFVPSN